MTEVSELLKGYAFLQERRLGDIKNALVNHSP